MRGVNARPSEVLPTSLVDFGDDDIVKLQFVEFDYFDGREISI